VLLDFPGGKENFMKRFVTIVMIALIIPFTVLAGNNLEGPADIVEAFQKALKSGDRELVLTFLDPDLTVFESGFAEASLEAYASDHLDGDLEFNSSMKRKVLDQSVFVSGDAAWVLTRSRTKGKFRGTRIDISGTETFNLIRRPEGWRIVHIHTSNKTNK